MITFNKNVNGPTLFTEYPFFSIGLFGAAAGLVLQFAGAGIFPQICFSLIPLSITAKIIQIICLLIIDKIEHPLTIFSLIILVVGPIVAGIGSITPWDIIITWTHWIGKGFWVIGVLGILTRIFIAIFIEK